MVNPKDIFRTKLLGLVPEIIPLLYDLQFNLEKQADSSLDKTHSTSATPAVPHGNNNSLCFDSYYSSSKHEQGPVETTACEYSGSEQVLFPAVTHSNLPRLLAYLQVQSFAYTAEH